MFKLFLFAALLLGLGPAAVVAGSAPPPPDPPCQAPFDPAASIESLTGSYVAWDPSVGGDTCIIPGLPQTFCFRAQTYTADWEYVFNLWLKFPAGWTVTGVQLVGTPVCSGGGSWGSLSWSYETSPYEIDIYHPRYQAVADDCLAYYCIGVIPSASTVFVPVSWYYDGDGYGTGPHNPCSFDQYTPPSMGNHPCDEAVNPPAMITGCCPPDGVYLIPETQEGSGCNGEPMTYTLGVYNRVGADWTFDLAYTVTAGLGALTGPAALFVPSGDSAGLQVVLAPGICAQPGSVVAGRVDVSGNGYSATATIAHTVTGGGDCPACALQGSLEGVVLDAEAGPAPPCTAAAVAVSPGAIALPVDPATGAYGPLALVPGDYTLEAAAPGYSVETAVVTVVDKLTTTHDFDLYRPVVVVEPPSIAVSAPPSAPLTVTLAISNLGRLPLEWELAETSTLPWARSSPSGGAIPALGSVEVAVAFECAPGQAGLVLTGTLRLEHGDPCAGPVDIPVEMACQAPLAPAIAVTPSSLSAELCPDHSSMQPITICNTGDLPLIWELSESWPGGLAPLRLGETSLAAAPTPSFYPAQLVLDDGSWENDIGIGGTVEFIWVNRFTPLAFDFPFDLAQVWVYFSSAGLVGVGDGIVLAVYENTSGSADPAVGSTLLAAFPAAVQALDAWNIYDLSPGVLLEGPGDVIVGVIAMAVPGASYSPAAIDMTASQHRSWAGWWNISPPPDPPLLPPDGYWVPIDDFYPGNWMVRGYGGCVCCDIPWLSEDPTAGILAPGACRPIDVAFDPSGLEPGGYVGSLRLDSNDPARPEITIPVSLTVPAPAEIVSVDYVVTGLQVAFDATVTGTLPLTCTWTFGDGGAAGVEDPTHTYPTGGCYTVTLELSNPCGSARSHLSLCLQSPYHHIYLPLLSKPHS